MPRYLKKRDLVAYYVLSKKYSRELVELDTIARDLQLMFGYSKKTSYNIVKRLVKLGLIKKVKIDNTNWVAVTSIEDYLDSLFIDYLTSRVKHGVRTRFSEY